MKNRNQTQILRNIKTGALALILAGFLSPVVPQAQQVARVDAGRMSCGALRDFIYDHGAAIVKSRSPTSGRRLSERYVSDRGFCFHNETTIYRDVSTRDTDYCSLRLCTERRRRRRR